MKALKKSIIGICLFTLFIIYAPQKTYAQEVSFQVFYDGLSPYGSWVTYGSYGYVWVPSVPVGFSPYASNGYWVWTDDGWTWVSNYAWGWAPFHYGRWDYDGTYGWFWVPDYTWGPAWVCWRHAPGYYGWAPLRPGISVSVAIGGGYYAPARRWCFVDAHHMGDRYIGRHYIPRANNPGIINRSSVIRTTYVDHGRNTTYIGGPARADVAKARGSAVTRYNINNNKTPGSRVQGHTVNMYRPQVVRSQGNAAPKPGKVQDIHNLRTVKQRRQTGGTPAARTPNQVHTNPAQRKEPGRVQPSTRQPNRVQPRNQPQRRNNSPQPRVQQPRIQQPRQQPRMQQPRPQPRMQQPRPQPRMQQPRPQPRMQQPRPQPRMQQPQPRPVPQPNMNPGGGRRR